MPTLPSQELQPIGNYGESCTQFRMPVGWEADYAAYVKQWHEKQALKQLNSSSEKE